MFLTLLTLSPHQGKKLIVTFCGMRLQCLQRWREWTWQAWMAVICFLQGTHAFVNWSEPSLQKWALNEKEGYLTRHGMHLKKGIYRLILPIRWILEKAKPDPLAYSMAPSPHGVHSGRSVSLAMLILPGSSDKLGQAWASAQLKGWKSRDMEKLSFRHDRWRMLMGIPSFSFSAEAHIHTRRPWRSENGICWSCQRCPSLITLCFWEMEAEYNFHSHKQYLLVVLTFCVWRPHGKIFLSADFQCQSWSRCMEHRLS